MNETSKNDLRPALYLITPSDRLLREAERATAQLGVLPLAFESFSGFFSHYDEMSAGCIVYCVEENAEATIEFMERILQLHPAAQIILCVSKWNVPDIILAVKHGAADVIGHDFEYGKFEEAIKTALNRSLTLRNQGAETVPQFIADKLSSEEATILTLMIEGKTIKEVGTELDLSVRTIHYRKKSIFSKLGVQDRTDAIEMVRRLRRDGGLSPLMHRLEQA